MAPLVVLLGTFPLLLAARLSGCLAMAAMSGLTGTSHFFPTDELMEMLRPALPIRAGERP